MCAKNKNISVWREQAIIEWSRRLISIVACCHGAKLCAYAARDFRSQQSWGEAIQCTRMLCQKRVIVMSRTGDRNEPEKMSVTTTGKKDKANIHTCLSFMDYKCLVPDECFIVHKQSCMYVESSPLFDTWTAEGVVFDIDSVSSYVFYIFQLTCRSTLHLLFLMSTFISNKLICNISFCFLGTCSILQTMHSSVSQGVVFNHCALWQSKAIQRFCFDVLNTCWWISHWIYGVLASVRTFVHRLVCWRNKAVENCRQWYRFASHVMMWSS